MIDVPRGQELLKAQIGKPYIFGYEVNLDDDSPKAFDCSELVEWFFHKMGLFMPDGSYNQYPESIPIGEIQPITELKPFDLGFLLKNGKTIHHVAINLDGYNVIQALDHLNGVITEPLSKYMTRPGFTGWRRPKCLVQQTS